MNMQPIGGKRGLSTSYVLSNEERYTLIDIARYDTVDAVNQAFLKAFIVRLAKGAAVAMYGQETPPTPEELESETRPQKFPCDYPLALGFMPLFPLPEANTNTNTNKAEQDHE